MIGDKQSNPPPVTHIDVGGAVVRLITEGDRVAWHAEHDEGGFEPETLACWAELCRGGVALDIGAYTGIYAISAALLGSDAVAFEPFTPNRERLIENMVLNAVNIAVLEDAISDKNGTEWLSHAIVPKLTSGGSLMRRVAGQRLGQRVSTRTIDSFKFPTIEAIKIDVERAEPLVLAGARETLARCRPSVIVEALDGTIGMVIADAMWGYRMDRFMDGRNLLMVPT